MNILIAKGLRFFLTLCLLFLFCKQKQDDFIDPAEQKIADGKTLYLTHCIACHNPDPTFPGSVGPEVKGAGLELLKSRITRAEYPPGYKPKRQTKIMPRLPLTDDNITALAAFLAK